MAIDVSGFVTPEQEFLGLYKAAETLERKNYRDQQSRLREEELQQQKEAKRTASARFFANYLDPNERFTGTKFDPVIYKLMDDAKNQAYDLIKQGVSDTDVLAAINPIIHKVDNYSQSAKVISEQKKQALNLLKTQKGVNPSKFSEEFDDVVFMDYDPKTGQKRMKDLSRIDPNINYTDIVLRERPVYTSDSFDDFIAKSGKETIVEDVSVRDRNKGFRRTKAEITKPSFMVSEKDAGGAHIGFVPQHEIAADANQPVLSDFMTEQGVTEEAPVRMVTPELFRSLPDISKAYLRQEAIQYAKENKIDPSDPRVDMFARALAYDELKRSAKQYSTLKEVSVKQEPPVRNTTNIYMPGAGGVGSAGNVLNTIEVKPGVKDGVFDMTKAGNKKNLAYIQALVGEDILPNDKINSNRPEDKITYEVEDGEVKWVMIDGIKYDRDWFNIRQNILDKEPKWAGKLIFPTEQRRMKSDGKEAPAENKMVTVVLKDGRKGEIPESSLRQFLKDNPGAKKQ